MPRETKYTRDALLRESTVAYGTRQRILELLDRHETHLPDPEKPQTLALYHLVELCEISADPAHARARLPGGSWCIQAIIRHVQMNHEL